MYRLALITTAFALLAAPAFAQDAVPADAPLANQISEAPPIEEEPGFPLQLSAGLKGGLNGVAGYGLPDNAQITGTDGTIYTFNRPEYYGHFGLSGSGGAALEIRAMDFVGLEFGFYYAQDNANGYVDKNDANTGRTLTRIESHQTTTAYHIPIMLKLNVPSSVVRPFLGLGLGFVRQIDSDLEYTEDPQAGRLGPGELDRLNRRNQIETSNYMNFLFSLGIEVVAGPVRIPIELRGGYNLGYDRTNADSRAYVDSDGSGQQIVYNGQYMGHFQIFTGVLYEFDLLL